MAEEADVIVLGSRPRTNIRRLILGSVSSVVATRASCEVDRRTGLTSGLPPCRQAIASPVRLP